MNRAEEVSRAVGSFTLEAEINRLRMMYRYNEAELTAGRQPQSGPTTGRQLRDLTPPLR